MQAPLKRHMNAAERVLRYLAGTKELGLIFGREYSEQKEQLMEAVVLAFADADWANDKIDRKSITGWVAKLNGDVISWASASCLTLTTRASAAAALGKRVNVELVAA